MTVAIIFCIAAFLAAPCLSTAGETGAIQWISYNEAQKRRGTDARKFFVYFHADWCTYCHKLEKDTFSNADVADYINTNYTPVLIDSDKEKQLAARFRVQGLPDLRFLDARGQDIARWPGFIESGPLLDLLRFIHTDSYETMSFKDFLKNRKK
jgi:thioredoxin-related protein